NALAHFYHHRTRHCIPRRKVCRDIYEAYTDHNIAQYTLLELHWCENLVTLPALTMHGAQCGGFGSDNWPWRCTMSRACEIRGRIADQAHKLIGHFYGLEVHLSASNFPAPAHGATRRRVAAYSMPGGRL